MCIICASPKGAPQPTAKQIKTMFANNRHGAGYMVARNGRVEIHKGFMLLEDLLAQLEREQFTPDDVVVYHFRISTQAGVTPEMTQPFPVGGNIRAMEALDLECAAGVAHNGIIPMTSNGNKRLSDTAQFALYYLPKLIRNKRDLDDPQIHALLEELTRSKLAILDNDGRLALVGSWVHEANGLQFSNTSYQESTPRTVKSRFAYQPNPWYDDILETI